MEPIARKLKLMKTAQEYLSQNLKRLRKARGLTQNDVAAGIDISLRSYQKYEQLESFPDDKNLDKLREFFKIGVSELFSAEPTSVFMGDSKGTLTVWGPTSPMDIASFVVKALKTEAPSGDEYSDDEKKLIAIYRMGSADKKRLVLEFAIQRILPDQREPRVRKARA